MSQSVASAGGSSPLLLKGIPDSLHPSILNSNYTKGQQAPIYQFGERIEESFLSYEASQWAIDGSRKLDDGSPIPIKKQFVNVSYDAVSRTFRGSVDWAPPTTFESKVRWNYRMVFSVDLSNIVDGECEMIDLKGNSNKDFIYRQGDCRRVGEAVPNPSAEIQQLISHLAILEPELKTDPSNAESQLYDIYLILAKTCNENPEERDRSIQMSVHVLSLFAKLGGVTDPDGLLANLRLKFEQLLKILEENPSESTGSAEKCSVCQEEIEGTFDSMRLCGSAMKSGKKHPRTHKACMTSFLEHTINSGFVGKCPQISCPNFPDHLDSAREILEYQRWSRGFSPPMLQKYKSLAEGYMHFLCGNCHSSRTTLLDFDPNGFQEFEGYNSRLDASSVFICQNKHPLLQRPSGPGWICEGRLEPEGCKCGNSVEEHPRWSCRNCDIDYCGPCMDAKKLAFITSAKHCLATPIIRDLDAFMADFAKYQNGKLNLAEFYSSLFETHALELRLKDDDEVWKFIRLIAIQIIDPERRSALQLRHWTARPRFKTLCCRREHCFKCKTKDFHVGKSCAENIGCLDSTVIPCPKCGVYLTKSDGCSSITCVCTHRFDWENEKVLYTHVRKFATDYPEDTAVVCADILCGSVKNVTHESANYWRNHNQSLVDRLVLKSWHKRFQGSSNQVLAKILQDNTKLRELNIHNSAFTNYLAMNRSKAEHYLKQMKKSKNSKIRALYPKPLDKYLALDYYSKIPKPQLSSDEIDTFDALKMYKKERIVEWSKINEEMIWKSSLQFLAMYGDNSISTSYVKFNSNFSSTSSSFSTRIHFWDPEWSNNTLEYYGSDDDVISIKSGEGVYAKRPGNRSNYPAAFCRAEDDIDVFRVKIVEIPRSSNTLSFGVSKIDPARNRPNLAKEGGNGVGKASETYGFWEDRGNGSAGAIFAGRNSPVEGQNRWRKLEVGDILSATLNQNTMEVEIALESEDDSHDSFSHTISLPPGGTYCFAMTFSSDSKVKIINDDCDGEFRPAAGGKSSRRGGGLSADGVLSASSYTLNAQDGNRPGGGTRRECAANLANSGTEPWNKWFHSGVHKSYVEMKFKKPETVLSYGLCSANDMPGRDPNHFELQARSAETEKWETIHVVAACPFDANARWQWLWFNIPQNGKTYTMIKLKIKSPRQAGDGIQLGHFHVKTLSSSTPEQPVLTEIVPAQPPAPVQLLKQISSEFMEKYKNFKKLLKCLNALETIEDVRIDSNLRAELERRSKRANPESKLDKQKIKDFVKANNFRILDQETWNGLFNTVCFHLTSVNPPYDDSNDPEMVEFRALEFMQENGDNAGYVAARLLLPNSKEPKQSIMLAKSFAQYMPWALDEWYNYNASLREDSLIPELRQVSKGCRCIPRCVGSICKEKLESSSSSSTSAGGGGGGGSSKWSTAEDEDDDDVYYRLGCGEDCRVQHSGEGNCLVCGRSWGEHGGHTCREGSRGSWLISETAGGTSRAPPTADMLRSILLFPPGSGNNP